MLPCKESYHNEGDGGYDECGNRLDPYVNTVECIAAGSLRYPCEEIVTPLVERCQKVAGDTSVCAVRSYEDGNGMSTKCKSYDEQHEHGVSQPFLCR